jgi:hypothetical protein
MLPVLVFLRHQVVESRRSRDEGLLTTVVCLDKRTGRPVLNTQLTHTSAYNFRVWGDAANRQVKIRLPLQTITLALTDEPIPPEPPLGREDDQQSAAPQEDLARAVGGLLRSIFGSRRDEPAEPDPFDDPQEAEVPDADQIDEPQKAEVPGTEKAEAPSTEPDPFDDPEPESHPEPPPPPHPFDPDP